MRFVFACAAARDPFALAHVGRGVRCASREVVLQEAQVLQDVLVDGEGGRAEALVAGRAAGRVVILAGTGSGKFREAQPRA